MSTVGCWEARRKPACSASSTEQVYFSGARQQATAVVVAVCVQAPVREFICRVDARAWRQE